MHAAWWTKDGEKTRDKQVETIMDSIPAEEHTNTAIIGDFNSFGTFSHLFKLTFMRFFDKHWNNKSEKHREEFMRNNYDMNDPIPHTIDTFHHPIC